MIVLAPTGVAAINAGGQTIHSFFKIRPSVYPPDDSRLKRGKGLLEEGPCISDYFAYNQSKIDLLNQVDTIVIDEISMVRSITITERNQKAVSNVFKGSRDGSYTDEDVEAVATYLSSETSSTISYYSMQNSKPKEAKSTEKLNAPT